MASSDEMAWHQALSMLGVAPPSDAQPDWGFAPPTDAQPGMGRGMRADGTPFKSRGEMTPEEKKADNLQRKQRKTMQESLTAQGIPMPAKGKGKGKQTWSPQQPMQSYDPPAPTPNPQAAQLQALLGAALAQPPEQSFDPPVPEPSPQAGALQALLAAALTAESETQQREAEFAMQQMASLLGAPAPQPAEPQQPSSADLMAALAGGSMMTGAMGGELAGGSMMAGWTGEQDGAMVDGTMKRDMKRRADMSPEERAADNRARKQRRILEEQEKAQKMGMLMW